MEQQRPSKRERSLDPEEKARIEQQLAAAGIREAAIAANQGKPTVRVSESQLEEARKKFPNMDIQLQPDDVRHHKK